MLSLIIIILKISSDKQLDLRFSLKVLYSVISLGLSIIATDNLRTSDSPSKSYTLEESQVRKTSDI
jgi:hypothetical protein